jgi:hypothetical protein
MKRFLFRLAIFALSLLCVCSVLDIFISAKIKKSGQLAHGEYDVWNDIYSGKINSDLVIYGSSRAWVHIDPELISKAFNISAYNLGIDGHKFRLQNFRHNELLKYNKPPKIIIYSLDIFTFAQENDSYNYDQFLPYMFLNFNIYKATRGNSYFNFLDFVIPGVRYSGKNQIINYAFSKKESYLNENHRIRGFETRNLKWNNNLENAKIKMGHYVIKVNEHMLTMFEKFLNDCKKRNIKVILVYTPEYIEGQIFEVNRKEIIELYQTISQRFNVPFYNYSNDSICFQKKYFYNASHLNTKGSVLFTNKFIKDLKQGKQIQEQISNYP